MSLILDDIDAKRLVSGNRRIHQRFATKVCVAADGCWHWTGALTLTGYGRFLIAGKTTTAQRASYELFIAPVPTGLEVDHLCRNRACVNPDHLEAVTHAENLARSTNFAAENGRKTHCAAGHAFDEANTFIRPNGSRECRTCRRRTNATARQRRQVAGA